MAAASSGREPEPRSCSEMRGAEAGLPAPGGGGAKGGERSKGHWWSGDERRSEFTGTGNGYR